MRILLVLGVVGHFLRMFCLAFVPPLIYAVVDALTGAGDLAVVGHFSLALVVTFAFGTVFARTQPVEKALFRRAEALAVVSLTWLAIAWFGAIPYTFAGLTVVDSFFESMSGFTTTGATVLTDFDQFGHAFFLWRAMTQWFGGLGVIALFVVILPRVGIAGRQLFFAEASGAPGESISPSIRGAAQRLWVLYIGLTLLLIALLIACDMEPFDAVCNALTTLAAGGFSPHPESIAGYDSASVEWVLIVFMIIAGTSFPLLWTTLSRKPLALLRDGEFLLYFSATVLGAFALALIISGPGLDFETSIRQGLFQSASLISSTGFASTDYALWTDSAHIILVVVMLVSGCAGSAAGGPKSVRHLFVAKHVRRELRRVLHPRAVIPVKYKGRPVKDPILHAVFTLVVLYVGAYFAVGVFMVLMGNDIVTGFSASLAAVGNIGPGFGEAGPMGSFAGFSDIEKIVLSLGMWVGRLEIITVLTLLSWSTWRNLHWRSFTPGTPPRNFEARRNGSRRRP